MMSYGNIHRGQHWLRQRLVAWWHQAIAWTDDDLTSKVLFVLWHSPEGNLIWHAHEICNMFILKAHEIMCCGVAIIMVTTKGEMIHHKWFLCFNSLKPTQNVGHFSNTFTNVCMHIFFAFIEHSDLFFNHIHRLALHQVLSHYLNQ